MLHQTSEPAIREEEAPESMTVNKDPRARGKPGAGAVFGFGRRHSLVGYVRRHDNGCCIHVRGERLVFVFLLMFIQLMIHIFPRRVYHPSACHGVVHSYKWAFPEAGTVMYRQTARVCWRLRETVLEVRLSEVRETVGCETVLEVRETLLEVRETVLEVRETV